MAFVDRNILSRIFGQDGFFGSQGTMAQMPETDQQRLLMMLAGAGSGMTQASGQPGARFAQALGGGAAGMMQGQQQHAQQQYMAQQQQMQQLQMQQLQQQAAREEERQRLINKLILGDDPDTDFMSSVDAQPSGPTAVQGRGPLTAQHLPPERPYRIGQIAAQYETSGRGVRTISSGEDDPGGVSYGTFQLSTNTGTMADFLASEEARPFAHRFAGLEPGTPAFNQAFEKLTEENPELFQEAERGYLARTHFEPVAQAAMQMGFNVQNPAIGEALFSQSVQHSGAGNLEILNMAASQLGPNASDRDVVNALYDARGAYASQYASAAATTDRYARERGDVLRLLDQTESQGLRDVAAASYENAPQPKPLADRLNLTDQEKTLLRVMDSDQQMAFILQKAGMSTTKQPDKVIVAEQIAAQTGREVGDVLAEMEKVGPYADSGGSLSDRDKRINDLTEIYGSRELAVLYDSGALNVQHNPVDGTITYTDMSDPASPQVRELQVAPSAAPAPEETPRETLYEASYRGHSTGLAGGAAELSGRITGQFGHPTGVQATEDRQQLRTSQNELIRSLSINPRFPVAEMERLREEINISPSLFDSPEALRARMRSVDRSLATRLATERRVMEDPNQGREARAAARSAVNAIEAYRRILGVPDESGFGQGLPADAPPAPTGWEEDWEWLTPEEREQVLNMGR